MAKVRPAEPRRPVVDDGWRIPEALWSRIAPPPWGLGAIEPVAARRASGERTRRDETENRWAICARVPSPASTARTTRSRKSLEYVAITSILTEPAS